MSSFPVPSSKRIAISSSQNDYRKLVLAQQSIQRLMEDPGLRAMVSRILEIDDRSIDREIVEPFENMIIGVDSKISKKSKPERAKQTPKRDSYFTRVIPATDKTRWMYETTKSAETILKLKVEDQENSTCPFDVAFLVKRVADIYGWDSDEMKKISKDEDLAQVAQQDKKSERKVVWRVVKQVVGESGN